MLLVQRLLLFGCFFPEDHPEPIDHVPLPPPPPPNEELNNAPPLPDSRLDMQPEQTLALGLSPECSFFK